MRPREIQEGGSFARRGELRASAGRPSDEGTRAGDIGQPAASSVLLLPLLILAGCLPVGDPLADATLPPAVESMLRPRSLHAEALAPGILYRRLESPEGPWVIHLLEVDPDRCELGMTVLADSAGEGGLSTVSELSEASGFPVVAAVNGDFFTPEGKVVGPTREAEKVIPRGGRSALVQTVGGEIWIGIPGGREGRDPPLDLPVQLVLGGFPALLSGGERVGSLEVSDRPDFAGIRHPRTAVGRDREGRRLWLVVVEGRRQDSVGMTLPELADLMAGLGAEDALNLDGGGSSVMIVEGEVVSRPSEPAGERPVANALAFYREDPARCAPVETVIPR